MDGRMEKARTCFPKGKCANKLNSHVWFYKKSTIEIVKKLLNANLDIVLYLKI